jgi:hypothetical protein
MPVNRYGARTVGLVVAMKVLAAFQGFWKSVQNPRTALKSEKHWPAALAKASPPLMVELHAQFFMTTVVLAYTVPSGVLNSFHFLG